MLYDISKIFNTCEISNTMSFFVLQILENNVTMPDGTKCTIVLSATEERKLMSGGDFKLCTLLSYIMHL